MKRVFREFASSLDGLRLSPIFSGSRPSTLDF
jgi:hypothetical protein